MIMINSAYNLRRLAIILKDSIDAITVQDLDGVVLAWNKGAEVLYGYSEDEALGMSISKIMPHDTISEKMRYLSEIAQGDVVPSYETTRITKQGRVVDVWIVVSGLRNDSGEIDSLATTERDITSFKDELRKKDEEVKILKGLLPICAHCKKIGISPGLGSTSRHT